eukprot:UN28061
MQAEDQEESEDEAAEFDKRDGWFYCTPGGDVKGPFKTEQMANWMNEGWFKGDLKIRNIADTTYQYLRELGDNPFNVKDYCMKQGGNYDRIKKNGKKNKQDLKKQIIVMKVVVRRKKIANQKKKIKILRKSLNWRRIYNSI